MKFEPIPTYTLNDGNKMPGIGMGCFMGYRGDGEETARTVKIALELGYRHIDTATRYRRSSPIWWDLPIYEE
ncbi:hypothetical protein FRC14_007900 [Serendipita sp. 396]|nr:hypothetical protein FRC14_007900 [Serendipita sp. 396]KAG8867339.1 hypothetical protein FRC20_006047 [Serendipita sp. 405]